MVLLGLACQAMAAYNISNCYLQHRIDYLNDHSGQESHLLLVQFKDEVGNVPTFDGLESLVLIDPNGNEVPIADLALYHSGRLDGQYDGNSGRWSYGEIYEHYAYFGFIEQPFVVGTYQLKAVFQGVQSQANYTFNGLVDLPLIPSSKIKSKFDTDGNLTSEWSVPSELWTTQPDLSTYTQGIVDFYNGETWVGSLYVRIPTHMGRLFVPQELFNSLGVWGNSYRIGIEFGTTDNNNRTYSKFIRLRVPESFK